MLASPLLPAPVFSQHTTEDSLQYRPSRDLEAFNSLLPPPIEFVEGSSSGTLAVAEGKYEPINTTLKAPRPEHHVTPKAPSSTPSKQSSAPATPSSAKGASLFPGVVDSTWPTTCSRATGLYNNGNTCFLNSALQCLLHTPPLLRVIIAHSKDACRADKAFCMICSMRQVTVQAHGQKAAFSPSAVSNRLQTIAKHMRRGRQEDSHEFLRYAIDALQKACLLGHPTKVDHKLAETTWVHKIFGGRLRSRVSCQLGHHSDTFDRILDLSLDILKSDTLKDALRKFVALDYLKGADQYKCEKCKKAVNAQKRFTIHEAPLVLTIHLKRFSPLGKKISHHVNYDEQLSLQPYMSEGQHGPSYSLYGVICHAGGGPNSGHYFAYVKSKENRWWEMNDESVTPISNPPTNRKNAYMLFYLRNKGQRLEAAVKPEPVTPVQRNTLMNGMKKRREREFEGGADGEDVGEKVGKPFIGPLLPSSTITSDSSVTKRQKLDPPDPQAAKVKSKIEAAAQQAKVALTSLAGYASGSDDDSDGEPEKEGTKANQAEAPASPEMKPSSESSPPPVPPTSSPAIPAATFYANGALTNGKKRKSPDSDYDSHKDYARQRLPKPKEPVLKGRALLAATNPFSSVGSKYTGPGNKFTSTYAKQRRRFGI